MPAIRSRCQARSARQNVAEGRPYAGRAPRSSATARSDQYCNGLAASKATASSRRVACSHSARRQRRSRRGSGALHRVHEVDDQLRGDAGRGSPRGTSPGERSPKNGRPPPRTTGTRSTATSSRRPSSRHCLAIVPAATATTRSPAISCARATAASTPSVTNVERRVRVRGDPVRRGLVRHHDDAARPWCGDRPTRR